jgi:hypothetical protein
VRDTPLRADKIKAGLGSKFPVIPTEAERSEAQRRDLFFE